MPTDVQHVSASAPALGQAGWAKPDGIGDPDHRDVDPDLLVAQGRILDAVGGGGALHGPAEGMARELGVSVANLTAALGELTELGWLALETNAAGEHTVRWAAEPG